MELERRIFAFGELGRELGAITKEDIDENLWRASNENPWFTPEAIYTAFQGLATMLDYAGLQEWTSHYTENLHTKKIGVVMAGNIPAVGFHDLLCVLMSGHVLHAKLSSKDTVLMTFIIDKLIEIESEFKEYIHLVERLEREKLDAVIATGSNNTTRYFDQYFSGLPNIIRGNRTSVAVINGNETSEDFVALGKDVFTYYGLGCRNIAKLFVPVGYSFTPLLDAFAAYDEIRHHHKYVNNYDYYKSIYLVNREEHLDTGFLLIRASEELVSPLSVLYYEEYTSEADLQTKLTSAKDKLQCVVGDGFIPFGEAQQPSCTDFADGVDTMKFLTEL